jgi:hypothetical protein
MGIQGFFPFIKENYGESIKKNWNSHCDNILFDLNHLLHNVGYSASDVEEIKSKLIGYLNDILINERPKKLVYIATDGQSAFGKMFLQRDRRYRHVRTLKNKKDVKLSKDTMKLHFTPRTKFMHEIYEVLKRFGAYVELVHNVKFEVDVLGNGEGELKVRNRLNTINHNEISLVYSGDTDMIPILMTVPNCKNIYQAFSKEQVISIGKLFDIHKRDFCGNMSDKVASSDFVLLNALMGNDYLPKVQYLMLKNVWKAYKEKAYLFTDGLVTTTITDNYTIYTFNIEFFVELINSAMSSSRFKNSFNCDKYVYNIDIYDKYLEGVLWCHDTYTRGYCNDYQYTFTDNRSSTADAFVPHFDGVILSILTNKSITINKRDAINPDLYSVLLMPSIASDFMSSSQKEVCKIVEKKYSIVHEREKCNKCTDYCIRIDALKSKRKEKKDEYKKINEQYKLHMSTHGTLSCDTVLSIDRYVKKKCKV